MHELKFYLKLKSMVKPVFKTESEQNSEQSENTFEQLPYDEMNGTTERRNKS